MQPLNLISEVSISPRRGFLLMNSIFFNFFPLTVFLIVESLLLSFITLKLICKSSPYHLNFLYISSGKSATNAKLLGGLSLSVSLIVGLAVSLTQYSFHFSFNESRIMAATLASALLVTFYGYIDDKFEVRVRVKLAIQLFAILILATTVVDLNYPEFSYFTLATFSFFGFALINGTNLVDGLDTLSIKMGSASALAYAALGFYVNSPSTIALSIVLLSSLAMFFFFNREPAKVYMGEIGGSIIGLIYFTQTFLCFTSLKNSYDSLAAMAFALMPGCLPICELAISFLRRIYFKRTPFRGDKLHLHYILKNEYKLTASQASTRMGASSACVLAIGLFLAMVVHPLFAFVVVVMSTTAFYLWHCADKWKATYSSEDIRNLGKIFEGKNVNVINSNELSGINFEINKANPKKSA